MPFSARPRTYGDRLAAGNKVQCVHFGRKSSPVYFLFVSRPESVPSQRSSSTAVSHLNAQIAAAADSGRRSDSPVAAFAVALLNWSPL